MDGCWCAKVGAVRGDQVIPEAKEDGLENEDNAVMLLCLSSQANDSTWKQWVFRVRLMTLRCCGDTSRFVVLCYNQVNYATRLAERVCLRFSTCLVMNELSSPSKILVRLHINLGWFIQMCSAMFCINESMVGLYNPFVWRCDSCLG